MTCGTYSIEYPRDLTKNMLYIRLNRSSNIGIKIECCLKIYCCHRFIDP